MCGCVWNFPLLNGAVSYFVNTFKFDKPLMFGSVSQEYKMLFIFRVFIIGRLHRQHADLALLQFPRFCFVTSGVSYNVL